MSTIAIKEDGTGEEEGRIDNKRKLGTSVRWYSGSSKYFSSMCSLMFVDGCNYVVVTWLGNALSMDDDRRTRPISAILFVNAYEKG